MKKTREKAAIIDLLGDVSHRCQMGDGLQCIQGDLIHCASLGHRLSCDASARVLLHQNVWVIMLGDGGSMSSCIAVSGCCSNDTASSSYHFLLPFQIQGVERKERSSGGGWHATPRLRWEAFGVHQEILGQPGE